MRYALRTDANQSQIVSALEAAGARVLVIGKPVDLLVGVRHKFAFFECKDGAKSASRRKKTALQDRFFAMYDGYPVFVVTNPEDAIKKLRLIA